MLVNIKTQNILSRTVVCVAFIVAMSKTKCFPTQNGNRLRKDFYRSLPKMLESLTYTCS
jgi:hypothetical protein